jgi:hypothetical protein
MNSFFNRAVVQDEVGSVGVLSVTAARRMALVSLEGKNKGNFCAEPPPDVSDNVSTSLNAAIKAKLAELPADVDLSVSDILKVEAVVLAKRTALLDVYRTGTYSLCQYRLNGFYTNDELVKSFNNLMTKVLDGMSKVND